MKKYLNIILTLVFVVTLASCGSGSKTKQSNEQDYFKTEMIKEAQQTLDSLKSHFNYEYDEFNKIGFYTHNNFSNDNIVKLAKNGMLTCSVNSIGGKYVSSFYVGDDWIFHTHFITLINGNKMPSKVVLTNEKNNVRKVGDDYVLENVIYNGENTNFDLIGMNSDKEIKVRLEGDNGIKDFTMSKIEKDGFRETYELVNALIILNSK